MTDLSRWRNKIIQGHALEELKKLPDEVIDCVVTSPPYWALRDYKSEPTIWGGKIDCEHDWIDNAFVRNNDKTAGDKQRTNKGSVGRDVPVENGFCSKCGAWRGSLGLEPSFDLYVNHLCDLFDEIKRVLKNTGSVWVNIGDTYSGGNLCAGQPEDWKSLSTTNKEKYDSQQFNDFIRQRNKDNPLPPKCLCMIPARFAIEMCNRGWILRNTLIWKKENCMPSSVNDRFTVDFEYIFFFTKKKKYYFEQQFEPYTKSLNRWGGTKLVANNKSEWDGGTGQDTFRDRNMRPNLEGRNKRTVWNVNTQPFSEAHFAVFPDELIETPINASCPKEICKKCGKPREKLYKKGQLVSSGTNKMAIKPRGFAQNDMIIQDLPKDPYGDMPRRERAEIGLSDCGCNAGFDAGIVLDPFMGSGTTARVAKRLGRNYIGFDLNTDYVDMAIRLTKKIQGMDENLSKWVKKK